MLAVSPPSNAFAFAVVSINRVLLYQCVRLVCVCVCVYMHVSHFRVVIFNASAHLEITARMWLKTRGHVGDVNLCSPEIRSVTMNQNGRARTIIINAADQLSVLAD